jgi:hypothetical protein
MATANLTTPTYPTDAKSTSAHNNVDTSPPADPLHKTATDSLVSPLEAALEEERSRLMLADSVLGCLQIALDPEAISVTPVPHFPEVLALARKFINKSVQRLEYEEIRRLLHSSMRYYK